MKMARSASTCKGCGAWVEWALLNGKPHPFEMKATADGEYELISQSGATRQTLAVHRKNRTPGFVGHMSHFAVCPNADGFRTKKREATKEA